MITEIVTFEITKSMGRGEVVELFEKSAPAWKANPHLVHKSFLYDHQNGVGGGVYLWDTIEAAREAHDASFCSRIQAAFGSAPEFRYFESPVVINNHTSEEEVAVS